jgi:predicted transglutaminase-like cysteine proteinase
MLKAVQSRVTRASLFAAVTTLVAVSTIASVATDDANARPKLKPTLPGDNQTLVVAANTDFSGRASYPLRSSPAPEPARSAPELLSSPPPAQYFTINEVLAQGNGASSSMRLAAVDQKSATDAPAPVPTHHTNEPFGFATFRAPDGILWTKWRKVQSEIAAEAGAIVACKADTGECKSPAARRFLGLVKKARERSGRDRIDLVNRSVNSEIAYTNDHAQHGVADLWSAPLAALGSGRGDCEDYAIAKYAALREAGTPAEDLRLLLVRDNAVRLDHAVLAVRHDGRWLVLDNRHAILMEQGDTRHFTPLFALDQSGVKLFAAPYAKPRTPVTAAKPTTSAISSPWPDDADLPLRGTISVSVAAAASVSPDELPPI